KIYMKTFLIAITTSMALFSCKTAYYDSPNDLGYINGTLYLADGKTLDGKISVNDGGYGTVKIYLDGDKKPQRFRFSEVEGYRIRNEYYERKEIKDGTTFNRNYRYHFMKRLTPETSKIGLYEYMDKETSYSGSYRRSTSVTSLEKNYYVQLPSEKEDGVW